MSSSKKSKRKRNNENVDLNDKRMSSPYYPGSWLDCKSIDAKTVAVVCPQRLEQKQSTTTLSLVTTTTDDNNNNNNSECILQNIHIPICTHHFSYNIFLQRLNIEIIQKYNYNNKQTTKKKNKKKKKTNTTNSSKKNDQFLVDKNDTTTTQQTPDIDNIVLATCSKIVISQRIKIGINSCTRTLEKLFKISHSKNDIRNVIDNGGKKEVPRRNETNSTTTTITNIQEENKNRSFLILMTDNIQPILIVQTYLISLARQLHIPIIMLSSSSNDIGKLLGIKNVTSILFLSYNMSKTLLSFDKKDDFSTTKDTISDNNNTIHTSIDSFIQFILRKNIIEQQRLSTTTTTTTTIQPP